MNVMVLICWLTDCWVDHLGGLKVGAMVASSRSNSWAWVVCVEKRQAATLTVNHVCACIKTDMS
jgi:hypothetical protein